MANKRAVLMPVEQQYLLDSLEKKYFYLFDFVIICLIQFITQPHSSNLPQNDVPLLQKLFDEHKTHQRTSSKPMSEIVVLTLIWMVVEGGQEDGVNGLIFRDFDVVGYVLQFQVLEDLPLECVNKAVVLQLQLRFHSIVRLHIINCRQPKILLHFNYSLQFSSEIKISNQSVNFFLFFFKVDIPSIIINDKKQKQNLYLLWNQVNICHFFYIQIIYSFNIVYLNMKIIINDGVKKYQERTNVERSQLQKFIESHSFFTSSMSVETLILRIQNSLKKNHQLGSRSHTQEKQYQNRQSLDQLALYLNKDNNEKIFTLFETILAQPKITYQALAKRLKTDIITVSHYCCKLKKLRLIEWEHQKQGVVVFPKNALHSDKNEREMEYKPAKKQTPFDIKDSFFFRQLGMNENIWINVSSEESVAKGGITNEEIKLKIMKHAENKMVRRTVESMKYFQRNAERQGKVFEFKYKNQTDQIKAQIIRKNQIVEELEVLDEGILEWLQQKFPQFEGEDFLLKLINDKFKDYISSLGVKQSRRQCTPLKLNRYVKVLNYLHKQGGMRESELRALIVRDQEKFNIGIMHKRSLLGILEGLKNLQIIFEEEGYYYPSWVEAEKIQKRRQSPAANKRDRDDYEEPPTKKKNHVDKSDRLRPQIKQMKNKDSSKQKFKKISQKRYRLELFAALLVVTFDKSVKKIYRKAFNRIVYVQRKKGSLKYTPQTNILYLLEEHQQASKCSIEFTQTLESFYRSLDAIVQEKGRREDVIGQAQNQLVKFMRKNPIKNTNSLRIKYGKNWRAKFEDLANDGIVEVGEEDARVVNLHALLI